MSPFLSNILLISSFSIVSVVPFERRGSVKGGEAFSKLSWRTEKINKNQSKQCWKLQQSLVSAQQL